MKAGKFLFLILFTCLSSVTYSQQRLRSNGSDFLIYGFSNTIDVTGFAFDSVFLEGAKYWELKRGTAEKIILIYPAITDSVHIRLYKKKKQVTAQTFMVKLFDPSCYASLQILKYPEEVKDPEQPEERPVLILSDSAFLLKIIIARKEEYLNLAFPSDNHFEIRSIPYVIAEGKNKIRNGVFPASADNIYNLDSLKNYFSPGSRLVFDINDIQSVNAIGETRIVNLSSRIFFIPVYTNREAYQNYLRFGEEE